MVNRLVMKLNLPPAISSMTRMKSAVSTIVTAHSLRGGCLAMRNRIGNGELDSRVATKARPEILRYSDIKVLK